ncbi:MAG: D-tagaturonate epimerase UxaE [Candidatus Caldatribacteriota bacterium]
MKSEKVIDYFLRAWREKYKPYPFSLKSKEDSHFFITKDEEKKYLIVIAPLSNTNNFEGEILEGITIEDKKLILKRCSLCHLNLALLCKIFPYLNPTFCGLKTSFGTGDRLGKATPAHLKAFNNRDIFPILAQQSVREMERTERNWQVVLDDAIWGCFEAGYLGPFGADADHVKEIADLKEAVDCGYSMFTLDPSDFIRRDISQYSKRELNNLYTQIKERKELEVLYGNKSYSFAGQKLTFTDNYLAEIIFVYSEVLNHIEECYKFLKSYKKNSFDLEISVDETPTVTSPLAHLFIILELQRRGIELQNLALHYLGDWQKGIEYIGDIDRFRKEFSLHSTIARIMGGYKLSLHTGSDKFSVYPIFAQETGGFYHIKTAGTTWLEEAKIVAMKDPALYREIHYFALQNFEKDRASYNLTTDLSRIPDIDKLSDSELPGLFKNKDSRQLIHITYGSILRAKDKDGQYRFKNKIFKILFHFEEEHYYEIANWIKKHLDCLNK